MHKHVSLRLMAAWLAGCAATAPEPAPGRPPGQVLLGAAIETLGAT